MTDEKTPLNLSGDENEIGQIFYNAIVDKLKSLNEEQRIAYMKATEAAYEHFNQQLVSDEKLKAKSPSNETEHTETSLHTHSYSEENHTNLKIEFKPHNYTRLMAISVTLFVQLVPAGLRLDTIVEILNNGNISYNEGAVKAKVSSFCKKGILITEKTHKPHLIKLGPEGQTWLENQVKNLLNDKEKTLVEKVVKLNKKFFSDRGVQDYSLVPNWP